MGKKQINSKRGVYDGIKFASQLEISCYKLLKEAGIDFEYEGEVFELMSEFHLENVLFKRKGMKGIANIGDSKVRKIYYTPDFVSDLFIIEAKGRMSQSFPLRWKMFLNTIFQTNDKRAIYMPTTKADCQLVVEDILKRFY
jgi:hypothetical protein|tara:strand:+ start:133 stop:555 length:423 start_codon:yes stop_codon:yes gene_type:complete